MKKLLRIASIATIAGALVLGIVLGSVSIAPSTARADSVGYYCTDCWIVSAQEYRASAYPDTALAASLALNGFSVGAQKLRITRSEMNVAVAGGGGAGNTVVTYTDGTNTCVATWACTATATTGLKGATIANGTGSGCTFPAGASITASVTTAGCTTTQPTARNLDALFVRRE